MAAIKVLGRARIYDTGDPPEVECWVHEFEPADRRSGHDWAREHFAECYSEKDLRIMFGLPEAGSFQVLFSGDLDGAKCSNPMEPDEWDEWFDIEEAKHEIFSPEERVD